MAENRVQVGWFNLREARTFTTHYECAAWFKDIRVEPGRYRVYAYLGGGAGGLGHTLYPECEGEIVRASFQALWAGSPIRGTRDRGPDEVGRRERASVQLPTYALEQYVRSGELELFPCCVAEEHKSARDEYDRNAEQFRTVEVTHTFYRYVA